MPSNVFIYSKGFITEKCEMEKPKREQFDFVLIYEFAMYDYNQHLATLRRFKYDYPDPGKEMEFGKHFKIEYTHVDGSCYRVEAIPITQRTYSEQEDKPLKQEGTKLLVVRIDGYLAFNTYVRESEFELMKGRLASVLGRPVPPEYKTFSEQDLLDTWNAGWGAANDDQERKFKWSDEVKRAEKQQFFKQKFGIEIK